MLLVIRVCRRVLHGAQHYLPWELLSAQARVLARIIALSLSCLGDRFLKEPGSLPPPPSTSMSLG